MLGIIALSACASACAVLVDMSGLTSDASEDATTKKEGDEAGSDDGGREAGSDAAGSDATTTATITLDRTNIVTADEDSSSDRVSASIGGTSPGATIFVAIKWQGDSTARMTSVTGGNLDWTIDVQGGGVLSIAIAHAYAPSGVPSSPPFTATFSEPVYKRVLAGASFLGVGSCSPTHVSPIAVGANPPYTSSAVAANPGDLVISAVEMYTSDGDWKPTAPTLEAASTNAPKSLDEVDLHYLIAASAGALATSATWSGAGEQWCAATAVFPPSVRCP